VCVCAKTEIKI